MRLRRLSLRGFGLVLTAWGVAAAAHAQQTSEDAWVADPEALRDPPFGADDQVGATNRLTPEVVLRAVGLVQEGEVVSLAIPLNRDTPAYGWRRFEVIVSQNEGTDKSNNEDYVSAPINTGTNLDGLAHMGIQGHFHGGRSGEDIQTPHGLRELGIEHARPIVARAHLLDMPALMGVDRLEIGYEITVTDIEAAMRRQGIAAIEPGDAVLFHTGHRLLLESGTQADRELFLSGQPGPGAAAAHWLAERGVVAVGGDSGSMEVVPAPEGRLFPVHQILLALNGIHIIENLATERLAHGGWDTFLFVAAPLPLTGSSSSWVNPLAIR